MGRSRFQAGSIRERFGKWEGSYWKYRVDESGREVRSHPSVNLGNVKETTRTEAKQKLREIIEAESPSRPDGAITIANFVNRVWLPVARANWRDTTEQANRGLLKNQVLACGFGERPLENTSLADLQLHINGLGEKGFSYSILQHSVSLFKQLFDFAVENEYVRRDPARKLRIPKEQRERHILKHQVLRTFDGAKEESYWEETVNRGASRKAYLTVEQMRQLCGRFAGRDRLIVAIACCLALRPSELFALTPESYDGHDLCISRRVYRGRVGLPGELKTPSAEDSLPVPRVLRQMIEAWVAEKRPCCWLFESSRHTPTNKANWERRVLSPMSAFIAGLNGAVVNFQMLRRSWVTNAVLFDIDLPEREAVLRHASSRAGIAISVYQMRLRDRLLEGLDKMCDAILGGLPIEAESLSTFEKSDSVADSVGDFVGASQ